MASNTASAIDSIAPSDCRRLHIVKPLALLGNLETCTSKYPLRACRSKYKSVAKARNPTSLHKRTSLDRLLQESDRLAFDAPSLCRATDHAHHVQSDISQEEAAANSPSPHGSLAGPSVSCGGLGGGQSGSNWFRGETTTVSPLTTAISRSSWQSLTVNWRQGQSLNLVE